MLENQLVLIVGLQHQGVFVKALDAAGELHSTQEVNSDQALLFACIVEKTILNVLCLFFHRIFLPEPQKGRMAKNRYRGVWRKS